MTRSRGVIWTIGFLRTYYFKLSVISATLRWMLAMSMMLSFQVGWKMRALGLLDGELGAIGEREAGETEHDRQHGAQVTHHERLGGLAWHPLAMTYSFISSMAVISVAANVSTSAGSSIAICSTVTRCAPSTGP